MKLKDLIGETFYPKAKDEQRFFDKHEPVTFKNIYSGEKYDHMFKGSNLKQATKDEPRHGYTDGADEKVYESIDNAAKAQEVAAYIKNHSKTFVKGGGWFAKDDKDLDLQSAKGRLKALSETAGVEEKLSGKDRKKGLMNRLNSNHDPVIADWHKKNVKSKSGSTITARDAYTSYVNHCETISKDPKPLVEFGRTWRDQHDISLAKISRRVSHIGVSLRKDKED